MTRRDLLDLCLAGSAGMLACNPSKASILARLNSTARTEGLAIIDTLVPEVIQVIGADAGRLVLPVPHGRLSVSPDGAWVAWFPYACNVLTGSPEGSLAYFTNNPQSARPVRVKGGLLGAQLAISSDGVHLAVALVVGAGPVTHLVVLNPATGELEDDVTDLITRFRPSELERLRISANGTRLVAGSRNRFCLLDLPSRKLLFEGEGRCPSLSPSGEALAFVDRDRKLNLMTVATGAARRLLERSITHGVGSWTPDGTLLFAGVESPLSFFWYLVAVDCSVDACAEIARLEEHDSGQDCGLINRHLLTPALRPT